MIGNADCVVNISQAGEPFVRVKAYGERGTCMLIEFYNDSTPLDLEFGPRQTDG